MAERITPQSKDLSQWYSDIIQHAKLADHSPVRGCMVLRPNGYALWEVVQRELNKMFAETGHQNAYFPIFIPESHLKKEKEHVEGFAPECAVVTHAGGKKLEEPLFVRPTSETIINAMYSKWIKSYRDLPVLLNQWANVVRWEMRTKPFLRTTEFLWQEGHTCHETEEEARRETLKMLDIYERFLREVFAIPTIAGEKTSSEKFAGALQTYCLEAMMRDKKALQSATSHYFGTRFAKVFDIKFQDRNGETQFVQQTTWGLSTRVIGALIMTHSDDQGLVIPPRAAAIPVIVIPILKKEGENSAILETANRLLKDLPSGSKIDSRDEHSVGFKFNEWEVQGIPLRLEIGPKDLNDGTCILARRDKVKEKVKLTDVKGAVENTLNKYQLELYKKASDFMTQNTFIENNYKVFIEKLESHPGFYQMHWCGKDSCEARVKEETKATIRVVPFLQVKEKGNCIACGETSGGRVIFARNY